MKYNCLMRPKAFPLEGRPSQICVGRGWYCPFLLYKELFQPSVSIIEILTEEAQLCWLTCSLTATFPNPLQIKLCGTDYKAIILTMSIELLPWARYYAHALNAHLTFIFVCFCHLHSRLLHLGRHHPSHGLPCSKRCEVSLFPLGPVTAYSEHQAEPHIRSCHPTSQTLPKILYSIWNKISSSFFSLQG